MFKILISVLLFQSFSLLAQNGLENILVEKYYVSNADDTLANSYAGKLPIGSTTYRIYADLLPGYRFQMAYGSRTHKLFFKTSTLFFNNEDKGDVIPNVIAKRTLHKNTVMLDSWLSAGSAAEDCFGVLKNDDDSLLTVVHEKLFLQNKSFNGIPISLKDGLVESDKIPRPTFFNIDSAVTVFGNAQKGGYFFTDNGAWSCMGPGSVGIDSLTNNRVLIAQITTDGDFSFELNIQIGTPIKGESQKYVARDPVNKEILLPSLIFDSRSFNKKNSKKRKSKK
jgi:hypothetical protein